MSRSRSLIVARSQRFAPSKDACTNYGTGCVYSLPMTSRTRTTTRTRTIEERNRLGEGSRGRSCRPPNDQLRGKYEGLCGFTSSESCEEELHRAFAHFLRWLGDHGQRRGHITRPKRVVEANDRNLLRNGNTVVADESDDAGRHFHICHKERGGRMWGQVK
jgi:hypothetical protein